MQITIVLDGTEGMSQGRKLVEALAALYDVGVALPGSQGFPEVEVFTGGNPAPTSNDRRVTTFRAESSGETIHVEHGHDTEQEVDPATVGFGQAGAPSTAAVPLSPTVPEAPPAGVPTPPPVSPPPVAPPAGSASAAPASPAPAAKVDKAGMPWDARIHAGTQTTKQDGTWKAKPGVDAETVAAVTAELKAIAAHAPLPPQEQAVAVPPPPAVIPPPPTVVTPPPPPPAVNENLFGEFMDKVMSGMGAQKISVEKVNEILAQHGMKPEQLIALGDFPEKLAAIDADVSAILGQP